MQRNITYQATIKIFFLFLLLVVYESLTNVYLWLPPLFGLAFLVFVYAVEKGDLYVLILTVLYLLAFEANKEFTLFSSLFFFIILYKMGLQKLRLVVSCEKCLDYISIAFAYIGFWLFTVVVNQLSLQPLMSFDWAILYYILIETIVVFFI